MVMPGDPGRLQGDARAAYEAVGDTVPPPCAPGDLDLGTFDVLVDALLGTGLDRELGGAYAATVEVMRGARLPVLAVDIPTGLHADTGRILGTAVRAEVTVTFIGLKRGLFTHDLLKGLRSGVADLDRDKQIDTDELIRFVSHAVGKASGQRQHPEKSGSGRVVLGVRR